MSRAELHIGDVFEVVAGLEPGSVQSIITSPPYWRKRAYLPAEHPEKSKELGQEDSPGEFLANLLRLMDLLWEVLADDGTFWVNLGDTAAGSGGAGGDYNAGGDREGQTKWKGTGRASWKGSSDYPIAKSVCWIPDLFGASLAYGRNLLTGEPCRQWITRPPVTWCKPAVTPGEIFDKFREATELFVWGAKQPRYHFDLDSVREPHKAIESQAKNKVATDTGGNRGDDGKRFKSVGHPLGAPPFNWWEINTSGYEGAHFATFPPELIIRPVKVSCPEGGTILDPFGGSGTTAMVATGHGRNCISIDIDSRNADLHRERVGMFLTVIEREAAA